MQIADENCGISQQHDLAVPPPLDAAEFRSEIFDPALGRRESEENKPIFVLPYGRARNRTRQKRWEALWINGGTLPSYTFKIDRRITIHNFGMLRSMCGKDAVSKITPNTSILA